MSTPDITGISVYIMVDGQLCLAPIAAESATLFLGMLPVFQPGQPNAASLLRLPASVGQHVAAAGRALGKHFAALTKDRGAELNPSSTPSSAPASWP